jgi:acyl dehydratase
MRDASLQTRHLVTDRDFLMGSVWEGTGAELHMNRLAAAHTPFRGRILSGLAGMTLALAATDEPLVWSPPAEAEWAFDAPLYEGSAFEVERRREGNAQVLTVSTEGRQVAHGRIRPAGPASRPSNLPETSRATAGRTFTAADLDLFRGWIGPHDRASAGPVPWPLLLLVASGLINRTDYLGPVADVVNRAMRWRFYDSARLGETVHCTIGSVSARPSRSRPEFAVATFDARVLVSDDGRQLAGAEWTVLYA